MNKVSADRLESGAKRKHRSNEEASSRGLIGGDRVECPILEGFFEMINGRLG
jgi:hypothetical protein